MKKIIYYVTDHGQGHATRTVAIIRSLLKFNFEIIIRNSNQVKFFEKSLPPVQVIPGITDVGPVMQENGISIDKKASNNKIEEWIRKLEKFSLKEIALIKKINPTLIISDISPMPFLAAHKTKTPSVAVSNFVWSDVLLGLVKDVEVFNEAYEKANLVIKLPLGTEMKLFRNKKKVGLVCRIPTLTRKEIRKKLGIQKDEYCVFISLGNYHMITCKTDDKVKFFSSGARVNSNKIINIENWVEGQDLVNASDLVICKCGYGMISECLSNGIPFYYLMDDEHREQKAISKEIIERGFNNRIFEKDLLNLDLTSRYLETLRRSKKEIIDTLRVNEIINQFIK